MKKATTFSLVPLLILLLAFSENTKESTIGVYDQDSVYIAMPRYQQALILCAKRDSAYQVERDTMYARRERQAATIEENAKTDSPLLHSLRVRDLAERDSVIVHYTRMMKEDSINYRNEVMQPVYTVALITAEYFRKEKKYVAVLKKNKLDSFRTANPGKYEIVNVTEELITRTNKY